MEIKRVALIGAGAIGAYFIEGLSDRLQNNFAVIADGSSNGEGTYGGAYDCYDSDERD